MASNLVAMASNIIAMASNLLGIAFSLLKGSSLAQVAGEGLCVGTENGLE